MIGVAHAGWKGLRAGVIEATVTTMRRLGAHATNRASFGAFNTDADIDRLVESLGTVARVMQL